MDMGERSFDERSNPLGRRDVLDGRPLIAEETMLTTSQMRKEDREDEWSHT